MKYKELVQFEPIKEIVKFHRLGEDDYRKAMVSSYVFSEHYEDHVFPEICRQLDYNSSSDTFGLQVVGTYGTGKSHLMSLVSLVAENAEYLPLVQSDKAQDALKTIAGKYKLVRFELGSEEELWKLVCFQIDKKLKEWNIAYSILSDNTLDSYKDKLERMMAQFEDAFPDKGMMIVIDEMLTYLQGRATAVDLNRDLAVLQALGEFSDHSKFRIIYGVQELIYRVPEFQFAANMLNLVRDRYKEIVITKQDVKYVVKKRMLKKTDEQKSIIRAFLMKFTQYFSELHANLDEYVDLFPVHPSFFENFQLIKIRNSQREILKTISSKFEKMVDLDIPETYPGLICYDSYWEDMKDPSLQTIQDIQTICEIMETIDQKIEENFTRARSNRLPLAHRIANACAVKILQESLDKANGTTAEQLVDELCFLDSTCVDREFLIDIVNTTAGQIVQATVGQYFELNDANQEYHIRPGGGVNYEQNIKNFVGTMPLSTKDSYFYGYLVERLPVDVEQYRREFKIYRHSIEWTSHKVMLDGYIFMGNPSERDTTHPKQNFYIYFMPIFDKKNMKHGDESDSVYFHFDKVSDKMKEKLELYAASEAQIASADSSQKNYYQQYSDKYKSELDVIFDREFIERMEVYYQGIKQSVSPLTLSMGNTKEEIIDNIASSLLEEHFCSTMENYPKFSFLRYTITSTNRSTYIKNALQKIAEPTAQNRDGEAILVGLGLMDNNQLSTTKSLYAESIRQKLEEKGEGKVLNRDEILYLFYHEWPKDWRSRDYHIGADLEFLVLSTMVATGEIEIVYDGKTINATNLSDITSLPMENYYSFSSVRKPKGMNISAVKELFLGITGKDMTRELQNRAIYAQFVSEAKDLASKAAKALQDVIVEPNIQGIKLFSKEFALQAEIQLTALKGICDKVQALTTPAKMSHLPEDWTAGVLREKFKAKGLIDEIKQTKEKYEEISTLIGYLRQAIQYVPDSIGLKIEMKKSSDRLEEIIDLNFDDPRVSEYKAELEALKEKYIEWYLSEYKRFHITELDFQDKQRLLNDPKNITCLAIFNSDKDNRYFSTFDDDYMKWKERMSWLTIKDSNINQSYLSDTPYGVFNPCQYVGKELPSLGALGKELIDIYDGVNDAFREVLKDESLMGKSIYLEEEQIVLLKQFTAEDKPIDEFNAKRLYGIIERLHKDFKPINITIDEIHKVLNRPMGPYEATKAFGDFLKEKIGDLDYKNVRIILK